jgi:hypothetical protein
MMMRNFFHFELETWQTSSRPLTAFYNYKGPLLPKTLPNDNKKLGGRV